MSIVYKLCRAFNTLFIEPKKCLSCNIQIYDDNNYCNEHKCLLCKQPKIINKNYCLIHICKIDECNNSNSLANEYCSLHLEIICNTLYCKNKKINRNNQLQKYCAMHICMNTNCGNNADYASFCKIHKCNNVFCNGEKTNDSYCDKHISEFSD